MSSWSTSSCRCAQNGSGSGRVLSSRPRPRACARAHGIARRGASWYRKIAVHYFALRCSSRNRAASPSPQRQGRMSARAHASSSRLLRALPGRLPRRPGWPSQPRASPACDGACAFRAASSLPSLLPFQGPRPCRHPFRSCPVRTHRSGCICVRGGRSGRAHAGSLRQKV